MILFQPKHAVKRSRQVYSQIVFYGREGFCDGTWHKESKKIKAVGNYCLRSKRKKCPPANTVFFSQRFGCCQTFQSKNISFTLRILIPPARQTKKQTLLMTPLGAKKSWQLDDKIDKPQNSTNIPNIGHSSGQDLSTALKKKKHVSEIDILRTTEVRDFGRPKK